MKVVLINGKMCIRDRPDILAYNYMGYDAVTVGNHEFDKPLNVLLKQMQWAEFPFVTSNICLLYTSSRITR